MSIRNLDRLFAPRSIALIGASRDEKSVGGVLARNLQRAGFAGELWFVNPKAATIAGRAVHRDIAALPEAPDLAVIATPPDTVAGIVAELGGRGTKAAVIITAGFGEGRDREGVRRRQAILDAARPHILRIVGPNCLGILVPGMGIDASFSHLAPGKGGLAFVTQSGAVITAMLDWAAPRDIGFSHVVSLGDMADVDFGDMLDWLALDGATDAILLYIETVRDARKFMSAARAASRAKPVIVVKAGRSRAGRRAAVSHTGAMAGADAVYDAAFRRAGMLRVADLDELFEAATTLSTGKRIHGDRLAILGNGGGLGVLATDALEEEGGKLAELDDATIARMSAVLPKGWSRGNPIDIIGDADAARYVAALEALQDQAAIDAVLVLNAPTAVASNDDIARAVAAAAPKLPWPLLTSWVGAATAGPARRHFLAAHLPSFETPRQAVRGFMHLVNFQRNREALMQTPVSAPQEVRIDTQAAQGVIDAALAQGRTLLSEPEAKRVLAACGIPVVATEVARDPAEAGRLAAKIGGPVALKIVSPDITHKSDAGGVALNLAPAQVETAAGYMLERVRQHAPQARIEGFAVQAMIQRDMALELILGMSVDPVFGPVLLFGHGGVAVERIADSALALPPLNMALAYDAMRRTRVFRLLEGYRARPPAALDAIAATLIAIGQAVVELPQIAEFDINPLLADAQGVLALDARIKVQAAAGRDGQGDGQGGDQGGEKRLAIKPYPRQLERQIALRDGSAAMLRPIRPEDEPTLQATFDRLDKEDVRMRFFAPLGRLPHVLAARLTQIDYDRQMAFVAVRPAMQGGGDEGLGVVRIAIDPNHERGEYAVVVRSDLKGSGLGYLLMMAIIDYARRQGLREIFGIVLRENERMLRMARQLGFTVQGVADDPSLVEVRLALR